MKYFFITILLFSLLCNCSKKSSQPVVDYSTDYEQNRRMLDLDHVARKQKQQTLVVLDGKVSDLVDLERLTAQDKIKSFKVITDSTEIKKLNYSYAKVKTVIIAVKK